MMEKPRCSGMTKIDCHQAHLSRRFKGEEQGRLAFFLFFELAFGESQSQNTFRSIFILQTPTDAKDSG